jgi:hypothetical protein
VTPMSTLYPFVGGVGVGVGGSSSSSQNGVSQAMDEFLVREKVDLVCATDLTRASMVRHGQARILFTLSCRPDIPCISGTRSRSMRHVVELGNHSMVLGVMVSLGTLSTT